MLGGEIFLGEVFRHLGNVGMFCLKRKGQLLGRFGQKTDVYFGLKPGEKKRGKKRKKERKKQNISLELNSLHFGKDANLNQATTKCF